MRFLAVFIASFMFSFPAICAGDADLSVWRVRRLLAARSVSELNGAMRRVSELTSYRASCDAELKSAAPPTSCFMTLSIESSEGLLSKDKAEENRKWLEETCIERATRAMDRKSLKNSLPVASLPRACLQSIRRRIVELDYVSANQAPDELFQRRFDE